MITHQMNQQAAKPDTAAVKISASMAVAFYSWFGPTIGIPPLRLGHCTLV